MLKKIAMPIMAIVLAGGTTLSTMDFAEAGDGRRGAFAAGAVTGAILGSIVGANARDRQYRHNGRAYGYGRGPVWDDHVAWCSRKYRSYDPYDNTWVSYGGSVRECRSPYLR